MRMVSSVSGRHGGAGLAGVVRGQAGFTLLEAVVAVGLSSLLLVGIFSMFSAAWRTEARALTDSQLQHEARGLMFAVVNGGQEAPAARGLAEAQAVLTDATALAFRVPWTDNSGPTPVAYDQLVAYYLAGTEVYRAVANYLAEPEAPLSIVRTGGTRVAKNISTFSTSFAATPTTAVTINVTASDGRGRQVALSTTCKLRNVPPPP